MACVRRISLPTADPLLETGRFFCSQNLISSPVGKIKSARKSLWFGLEACRAVQHN
jgi:hypothetical protein